MNLADPNPLSWLNDVAIVEVAPKTRGSPTYKRCVYEVGRQGLDELRPVLQAACDALSREGRFQEVLAIEELLLDWVDSFTTSGMTLAFHEPGGDDNGEAYRRGSATVELGDPRGVVDRLRDGVLNILYPREWNPASLEWKAPADTLAPRELYIGVTSDLQKRERQHRRSRLGRRMGPVQPIYETAVPERAKTVERDLIRWARGRRGLRVRNQRHGGGGVGDGHGTYWVYVFTLNVESAAGRG